MPFTLKAVELTVHDLALPEGATSTQIFNRANHLGLDLCPLELGPHLRLGYLDQPIEYATGSRSGENNDTSCSGVIMWSQSGYIEYCVE